MQLARGVVAVEHLDDDQIVGSVAVDVGKIDCHGRGAHVAERQSVNRAEALSVLVDPDTVGGKKEVVANVNVRQPVAINVAEHDGQPPIQGRRRERLAFLVHK